MTESETNKSETAPVQVLSPQTQHERWVKYGLNVALSVILVIAIAVIVIILAQWKGGRIDTTVGRVNSLKPQTINILKDINTPTKLVALYAEKDAKGQPNTYRQPVVDLLSEYDRKGNKIDVEAIDPVNSPSKVDALIAEVTEKYGGEVQKYKAVTDSYKVPYDQIKKITSQELTKVQALGLADEKVQAEQPESVQLAVATVQQLPSLLSKSEEAIDRRLKQKPPDYKAATSSIEQNMEIFSQMSEKILDDFAKNEKDAKIPDASRKYMAESKSAYQQIKKLSDDLLKQVKGLGELKLDDLRQSLRAKDAILVMGAKDMRVIPFEQVWKVDNRDLQKNMTSGEEIKPQFAGEQQVSTAILALSQEKKPKVAFVRMGGAPLAAQGFPPFQRGGLMSEVASRLRDYNFEVLEKDLSGMWAMQSQMSGQPPQPEATDEQLKDAIWVVLMFPLSQQGPMQPPANFKPVADHLARGGSAMLMFAPSPGPQSTENFNDTLKQWGIEVMSNAVAAHESIKQSERQQGDFLDQAQRLPYVFNLDNYGDHLITRPLRSLSGFVVPLEVVKKVNLATTQPSSEVTITQILPVPSDPKSWGETDLSSLEEQSKAVYEPDKGDIEGPVYGGAVAEKKGGGRLVVIGSPMFAFDRWVNESDQQMLRRGLIVARYPANAELFSNSIFWLARMEPMIAISPAAMEVSRIASMSDGALNAWRFGALLIGLPGLVLLAGGMVYFARRD